MALRHQVYIILPYTFLQTKHLISGLDIEAAHYTESNVVGIHHQSLFGQAAVHRLLQFYNFYRLNIESDNNLFSDTDPSDVDIQELLRSFWSTNFFSGKVGRTVLLGNDAIENPYISENKSGYTLVDLSCEGQFKYCFLDGISCSPMSSTEYMSLYPSAVDSTFSKTIKSIDKDNHIQLLTVDEIQANFPQILKKVNH